MKLAMMKSTSVSFLWILLLIRYTDAFVVGNDVRLSVSPEKFLRSTRADRSGQTRKISFLRSEDESNTPTTENEVRAVVKPDILQPFLPAMDPMYKCQGPVGEGAFLVSRTGEPTLEELANENILKIVLIECSDLEVNTLVWKCLGYRFDADSESWTNDLVFPNWRDRYPEPPDFIGMRRVYSKEVDEPSLRCNQSLVRSIPMENKQSLKPALKPLGFRGYQYSELTPNKTRRAQCANWLIYYRDNLFGYTVEELRKRRRQQKLEQEESGGEVDDPNEFKPPVKEVF